MLDLPGPSGASPSLPALPEASPSLSPTRPAGPLRALLHAVVERRVGTLVAALVLGALGVHAWLRTPIEAYPDVSNIQINVIAQLPGLAPEEIERQVTIPLERVLNGMPGMIQLRSQSLHGLSLVYLTFADDADNFRARTLVAERMMTADLPPGVVPELAPDMTPLGEVYQYLLESDHHDLYALRAAQEWTVARVFREIQGVADVRSFGGLLEELHVVVDPEALVAHGLTVSDVTNALTRSNLNVGGGFLRHGDQEMVVRGIGYLTGPRDVESVVLKSENGTPVTVGDVARVVRSSTPRRGAVGLDEDREAVQGVVFLRRGENPSDVLTEIHAKADALNHGLLPQGMRIVPFYDRTTLVDRTLHTVHHNLVFGFTLIVVVAWLFLRTVAGSLVVAAVIPLSLLSAFTCLWLLHLPANLISMGAIDFGILVDGAVILMENIIHEMRLARPQSRQEVAILVARSAFDVSRPTFYAMTIIIAALIPIFTLERVEGRIFRPLALTYSFALVASLVFALTVVPALAAMALSRRDSDTPEPALLGRIRDAHAGLVAACLRRGGLVVLASLALLAGALLLVAHGGREFLPKLDEGDMDVLVEAPASISLARAQDLLLDVRRRLLALPEVLGVMTAQGRPEDGTDNEGVNTAENFVQLAPPDKWPQGMTKARLVEQMRGSLEAIPGLRTNFSQPIEDNIEEAVSGVHGQVVVKIFGTDLRRMHDTLDRAVSSLRGVPGIVDLEIYRESVVPELQIELDRQALARAGIAVTDAQDVIETTLAGKVVTQYWQGERPIPVRVRFPLAETVDPSRIGDITVPAPAGARIPLRELAHVGISEGAAMIDRESNSRVMALKFNVEGRDLGSVVKDAMAAVDAHVKVPEGYWLQWGGEFENQQRAMARLRRIVPLSLLLVMALLYSALGSGRSAALILLTMPFAVTGGAFALAAARIPLSVSAAVGFIALLGQVSLAGLLVASAIDARRRDGHGLSEACVEGVRARFRALAMTTVLAILGLLPMAISTGAGSETQRPFAVVIIGGMVTNFLVISFLLPVLERHVMPRLPVTPAAVPAP